jgi:hypothetical protein
MVLPGETLALAAVARNHVDAKNCAFAIDNRAGESIDFYRAMEWPRYSSGFPRDADYVSRSSTFDSTANGYPLV